MRKRYVCLESVHAYDAGEFSSCLCGGSILGRQITRNPAEVTCFCCLQILDEARRKAERLDPILDPCETERV